MPTIRIRTDQLAEALKFEGARVQSCVRRALKSAADRWIKYLRHSIDDRGITNTGGYRDGFTVKVVNGRVVVENDHPAAGVLELGCAPHPVSIEGQELIRQWCIDKLGLNDDEARSAAFLICRKIREQGQEPKYIVRDAIPTLMRYFELDLRAELRKTERTFW